MSALTKLSLRDYWRVVWGFVSILIAGMLLAAFYPATWYVPDVAVKVGDALIVAGLIGLVVELNSLNRLIDKVGEDVARRTTAAHLPQPIRQQVWEIINSKLVYEDYQRVYRLTRRSGGRLLVESTISYKVRNYGFASIEYAPMLSEEEIHEPKFLNLEYKLTSGAGHAYDEVTLAGCTESRPKTRAREVHGRLPRLSLRPREQMPEEVCSVNWRYTAVMPEDYSDITAFGGATVHPTIRVETAPPNIDFFSLEGEGIDHVPGGKTWVFKRPFIAGQHVRVWWYHRADEERLAP